MEDAFWTPEHAQAVVDAAPQVAEATEQELVRTWEAIEQSRGTAAGFRRPARIAVVAALSAAALGVGGVAAAAVLSARTGEYPSDVEDIRLGGPGEELNPAASDYGTVITQLTADIPFPTDEARDAVRQNLVVQAQRDADVESRESTGALRAWVAQGAVCAWADSWAAANAAGDSAASAAAASRLTEASTWPAVTTIDPVQKAARTQLKVKDPTTGKVRTATVDDSTQFAYLPRLQKAVAAADVNAVDSAVAAVFCYGVRTPHLPTTAAHNK